MKKITLLLFIVPFFVFSQDDLLDELNDDSEVDNRVTSVFKSLKVVNFESTKLANKKDFYLIISHRFGSVKNGIDDFFGLDQAVTQFKFIYGINDWLNLGVARSSNQKKYGLHAKYRLKYQETDGFPVTIVGYNLITANTALKDDVYPNINFEDRLSYTTQILISRKFNDNLSLLVAPSYVHENLATRSYVEENGTTNVYDEENDQFAIGVGGRYKISKRVSINIDYGIHLNRNSNSVYKNPLSIGADIETGGHVFQVHFTNAQAMFEEGFISQAQGDWSDGDFFFGFNLIRVF
jgi:predicted porin